MYSPYYFVVDSAGYTNNLSLNAFPGGAKNGYEYRWFTGVYGYDGGIGFPVQVWYVIFF